VSIEKKKGKKLERGPLNKGGKPQTKKVPRPRGNNKKGMGNVP